MIHNSLLSSNVGAPRTRSTRFDARQRRSDVAQPRVGSSRAREARPPTPGPPAPSTPNAPPHPALGRHLCSFMPRPTSRPLATPRSVSQSEESELRLARGVHTRAAAPQNVLAA